MTINSFKLKDGKAIYSYTVTKNGFEDELSAESKEEPLDSLKQSLKALAPFVRHICEEPEATDIDVTGVSFSWKTDDEGLEVMGAVIIAKKKLIKSTGVLNLITPHRITHFYTEHGDEGQLMPEGMQDALNDFIKEARNYINGDRVGKQLDAFEEKAA